MAQCTCRICGNHFESGRSSAVICSLECRRVARRASSREYARRNGKGGSIRHRHLTCVGCGVEFEGVYGARRKYCTQKCRHQTAERRRLEALASITPDQATCSTCGVEIDGRVTISRKCQGCRSDKRDRTEYERRRSLAKYGLTLEQYDEMVRKQHGRCAICRTTSPGKKGLVVDHCHRNGHVRALLCGKCNTLIGLADEDPRILMQAMRYIGAQAPPATHPSRWQSPPVDQEPEPGDDPGKHQLRLAV